MKITVAEMPFVLAEGQQEIAVQIREPGTIRLASFSLQQRLISMREKPEYDEALSLFVEICPTGPLRNRRFLVLMPGQAFDIKDSQTAHHIASAKSERTGSVAHVYEIKDAS